MSIQDDVTRLVKRPAAEKRLATAETPSAIREQTGLERLKRSGASVTGEEVTVTSTDGLFTFTVRVAR